jgi:hypothetical protein
MERSGRDAEGAVSSPVRPAGAEVSQKRVQLATVRVRATTRLLLPTLLVWAVNRLTFAQRGRGTGWWHFALFSGQFVTPLVIAGLGAVAGASADEQWDRLARAGPATGPCTASTGSR